METKTGMTLDEFMRLPDDDWMQHELDAGELISMPPADSKHSRVAGKLTVALWEVVRKSGAGEVYENAGYVLAPQTVRQPDVSFLSTERIARSRGEKYFQGSPELAIEVVSPSDSLQRLRKKVKQYLAAGAAAVWLVDPENREVHVFEPNASPRVLGETDSLELPVLFPGWSLRVSEILV